MGTAAFDRLWGAPPPTRSWTQSPVAPASPEPPARSPTSGFDTAWDQPAPSVSAANDRALQAQVDAAQARSTARTAQGAQSPSFAQEMVNVGQGIPGGKAVEAFALSKMRGMPYQQAVQGVDAMTADLPTSHKVVGRMLGALPLAPLLPASPVAAGAILGAADQALAPTDESLGTRAVNTVVGAGSGALAGKAARGVANVAQRTGLTDLAGAGLRKVGALFQPAGDVGEAIGTKGAANQLLTDRQAVLDRLSGSEKSAAQLMLDHVEQYKQEAARLYGLARQDKAVIADPRVGTAMQDPHVQQLLQVTRQRLGFTPNPTTVNAASPLARGIVAGHVGPGAPTVSITPASPASAASSGAALPPAIASRMGASGGGSALVPATPATPASAHITVDLPTPEELALTKRLLGHIVTGKFQGSGLEPAEAAQLVPKLDALRAALHDASPAWKAADNYYANAKGFEDTFQKAYGVQQKPTASGLFPWKQRSPEAITASIDRSAGTPIGMAKASGAQAGAAARLAEAVKNAPLGADMRETLGNANGVFQPSENAAKVRRLAFGSDDDATSFNDLLSSLTGRAAQDAADRGPASVSVLKPWQALKATNPLATPRGQALRDDLAAQLADPKQRDAVLEAARRSHGGRQTLAALLKTAFATGFGAMQ